MDLFHLHIYQSYLHPRGSYPDIEHSAKTKSAFIVDLFDRRGTAFSHGATVNGHDMI